MYWSVSSNFLISTKQIPIISILNQLTGIILISIKRKLLELTTYLLVYIDINSIIIIIIMHIYKSGLPAGAIQMGCSNNM